MVLLSSIYMPLKAHLESFLRAILFLLCLTLEYLITDTSTKLLCQLDFNITFSICIEQSSQALGYSHFSLFPVTS